MKKNINNKNEYCCNEMKNTLEDPRVYIGYSSKYREYYINTDHSMIIHTIKYCPWCSEKLPESVRMRWFDILEKEYGIDHPRYEEQAELIPEEFKSDEWWKKRGL